MVQTFVFFQLLAVAAIAPIQVISLPLPPSGSNSESAEEAMYVQ